MNAPRASSWLAIDGGQSGLRARFGASRPNGTQILSEIAVGPGIRRDVGGVSESVLSSVRTCLRQLGGPGPVERAVIGLSGLPGEPQEHDDLAQALRDLTGARSLALVGDHVIAHAGALGRPGVVAAIGTGVVVLGVNESGDARRVDGCGYLFGDDGAATWIGRNAVRAVLRAQDGRGAATVLTQAAAARYGTWSGDGLIDRLYASGTLNDDVARFAPDVLLAASGGDRIAREIAEEAARLLAESIATAAAICRDPVEICVTGRLVAHGGLLGALLERRVAQWISAPRWVRAGGEPLDGAVWLARDGVPASYRRLIAR